MTSVTGNEMYIDPTIVQQRWSSNFNATGNSDYPLLINTTTGIVNRSTLPYRIVPTYSSYKITSTTAYTTSTSSPLGITYDTKIEDNTPTNFSNSTFIAPITGFYVFNFNVIGSSTVPATTYIGLFYNGLTYAINGLVNPSTNVLNIIYNMNSSDTMKIVVYNNSVAQTFTVTNGNFNIYLLK
jgi:hypothetical protein